MPSLCSPFHQIQTARSARIKIVIQVCDIWFNVKQEQAWNHRFFQTNLGIIVFQDR